MDECIKDLRSFANQVELANQRQFANALRKIADYLKTLPKEPVIEKGILCSEKLPARNEAVLCWVKSKTISSGGAYVIGSHDNGFWFFQVHDIGIHSFPVKDYEVVEWWPLPEPYKEESND